MTAGSVFPAETVLSDGSVFRVVPVGAGVRAIRAWAEYPWPMSPAQALALRDRLGWTSSPTDEEMLTTDHDLEEKDAWFLTAEADRGTRTVSSFNMSLTSRIPKPVRAEAVPITERAFDAYVEALTAVYGRGDRSRSRGVLSVTWTLPSDTSVEIGTVGWVIDADVDSPAAMRLLGVKLSTSMRSPTRTTCPTSISITQTADRQLCYGLSRAAAF